MSDTLADLGEERLIRLFLDRKPPPSDLLVDNGDDAAVFRGLGGATVVTTDAQVEGTHFLLPGPDDWDHARKVGRKLVSVNLSDLAAMGAQPRYALLSLMARPSLPASILRGIAAGLHERLAEHGVYLAGGNVSQIDGPMVLDLTAIGECAPESILRRAPSKAGDSIFVTGTLGDARGGLWALKQDSTHQRLVDRLLDPTPRVAVGLALARSGWVRAACDVSDGLGRDIRRLLGPRGADVHELPISPELRAFAGSEAETFALIGGEDYELLWTADPVHDASISALLADIGVTVTKLGTVTEDARVSFRGAEMPTGFVHFAS